MADTNTKPYLVGEDDERALSLFNALHDTSLSPSTLADIIEQSLDTSNAHWHAWIRQFSLFWAIAFWVVKSIPYESESSEQERLANAIADLQTRPPPPNIPKEISEYRMYRPWDNLPCLSTTLHDFARLAPMRPPLDERPAPFPMPDQPWTLGGPPHGRSITAEEWLNINAFVARIHGKITKPMRTNLDEHAIYACIEALETRQDASSKDDLIPCAAVWIFYAGERLRDHSGKYGDMKDMGIDRKRLPNSRGELWDGKGSIHRERWRFWMSRFGEIASEGDLHEGTRTLARMAFEKMEQLGDCRLVR